MKPINIGKVQAGQMDQSVFADMNSPMNWRDKAWSLSRAVEILNPRDVMDGQRLYGFDKSEPAPYDPPPNLRGVAMMLAGYSLEAMFKGLIVAFDPGRVSGGRVEFDHELVDLARDANVELSDDEKLICEILKVFVIYAGRYPSSRKASKGHTEIVTGSDWLQAYGRLFHRLEPLFFPGAEPPTPPIEHRHYF